jgi:hypothetical protein
MNLVEVSCAKRGKMPIAKNTAYKWHSLKKHPKLLYKVGGKLFFDMAEWETMAREAKEKQIKKSTRIRCLLR